MDYQYIEWMNQNMLRSYPLKDNSSSFPNEVLVDAVFFLDSSIVLKKVLVTEIHIEFHIETPIGVKIWRVLKENGKNYSYNDYGKIVFGDLTYYLNKPYNYSEEYNLEFEDCLCYPDVNLTILGVSGDVVIKAGKGVQVNKEDTDLGTDLVIELDEAGQFIFDGLLTINGDPTTTGNYILAGDNCTGIINQQAQITLYDKCLPPCYDCTERFQTGDVKQFIDELEARIQELES